MFKKRLIIVLTGLALLATVIGSSGVVAKALDKPEVTKPCACHVPGHGSGSGGGC